MGKTIIIKLISIYVLSYVLCGQNRLPKSVHISACLSHVRSHFCGKMFFLKEGTYFKVIGATISTIQDQEHTHKKMTQPFPVGMLYKRMPRPQQVSGVSQTLELLLVTCSSSQPCLKCLSLMDTVLFITAGTSCHTKSCMFHNRRR